MDLPSVQAALHSFILRHAAGFAVVASKETQALEVGALVLASEHYARRGYTVTVANLQHGYFRLKLNANGHPRTFSWYEVAKADRRREIHANLSVRSSYGSDDGRYVVDVGIVDPGHTPPAAVRLKDWTGFPNTALATFVEAKKLQVYPMLLAQFLGIVHEIAPRYLDPARRDGRSDDFFPALVSVGSLRGTSHRIREGFRSRGFRLNIIPEFDFSILMIAHDPTARTPFEPW